MLAKAKVVDWDSTDYTFCLPLLTHWQHENCQSENMRYLSVNSPDLFLDINININIDINPNPK